MRILIADDDPMSRQLLQVYLQRWGHEVTAAADGAEAWQTFQAGEFPLVVSDWMMPGLNGLELTQRIRSAHRKGYVYVILLTARSGIDDVIKGMDAGADDFISKPFDRDEVRVRLRAGERIVRLERAVQAAQVPHDDALVEMRHALAELRTEVDHVLGGNGDRVKARTALLERIEACNQALDHMAVALGPPAAADPPTPQVHS